MSKQQRALAIVLIIGCIGYARWIVLPAARANTHGFAAYYAAAYLLTHTPQNMEHVYDNDWFAAQISSVGIPGVYDIFNIQPPTMSLMLLPVVFLPPGTARWIWILQSLGLLLGGLVLLARALRLPLQCGVWIFPICLLYTPVTETLQYGQAYLLLFCLVCLLVWALLQNKDSVAGIALGSMLMLKSAAVWLWPLLLLKQRGRALLWACAMAASIGIISLPLIGVKTWRAYIGLLPQLARAPERPVTAYQTVTSLWGHLMVFDAKWNPSPLVNWPLPATVLTVTVLIITLVLSAHWSQLKGDPLETQALSLALFLSLVVTNTPFAEGYHYVLVLPAVLIAGWWAWQAKPGWKHWAILAMVTFLLGAPLPYKSPGLTAGWLALVAYPRVYGAFLLWGWLGWALHKEHRENRIDRAGRS